MLLFIQFYDQFFREIEVPDNTSVSNLRSHVINKFRDLNDHVQLVFNGQILGEAYGVHRNTLLEVLGISDRHIIAIWDPKVGKNPDKTLMALKKETPEQIPFWNGTFSSRIGIRDVRNVSYFFQQRKEEYDKFILNPSFRQAVLAMKNNDFIAWARANPAEFTEIKKYFAKYFLDQAKKKAEEEMGEKIFQDNVYPEAFLESAHLRLYDEDVEIQMAIEESIAMMNPKPSKTKEEVEEEKKKKEKEAERRASVNKWLLETSFKDACNKDLDLAAKGIPVEKETEEERAYRFTEEYAMLSVDIEIIDTRIMLEQEWEYKLHKMKMSEPQSVVVVDKKAKRKQLADREKKEREKTGPPPPVAHWGEYEFRSSTRSTVPSKKEAEKEVDWDEEFEGAASIPLARSDSQEPERPSEAKLVTQFPEPGSYFKHKLRSRGAGLLGLEKLKREPMVSEEKLKEMGKLPHYDRSPLPKARSGKKDTEDEEKRKIKELKKAEEARRLKMALDNMKVDKKTYMQDWLLDRYTVEPKK